jgi:hypothetical protein
MKKDKFMVSLNPEFGIEVEALIKVAERVRESRPDLYSILTIVVSVIIANDDKELLKHCNNYLTTKVQGNKFYSDLKTALGYYIDFEKEDKKKPPPHWFPPFEDDEL